jgi:hypothetical protein
MDVLKRHENGNDRAMNRFDPVYMAMWYRTWAHVVYRQTVQLDRKPVFSASVSMI